MSQLLIKWRKLVQTDSLVPGHEFPKGYFFACFDHQHSLHNHNISQRQTIQIRFDSDIFYLRLTVSVKVNFKWKPNILVANNAVYILRNTSQVQGLACHLWFGKGECDVLFDLFSSPTVQFFVRQIKRYSVGTIVEIPNRNDQCFINFAFCWQLYSGHVCLYFIISSISMVRLAVCNGFVKLKIVARCLCDKCS